MTHPEENLQADEVRLTDSQWEETEALCATVPRVHRGIRAVRAHEQALLRMTEYTLVMDVEQITANDHFGTVLGVLRAERPREISVPFCGLWRFVDGRIAEHWENTSCGPAELRRLFTPPPSYWPLADAG
ncbi:nuclear transport factor 2 family protein [Streptomyces asiaticus]